MTRSSKLTRVAGAILFSSVIAVILALGGLLLGMFLWGRFGPAPGDPDDTGAYLCGLFVGAVMGLVGGGTLLYKFWPRAATGDRKQAGGGGEK